jgi:uracil-DNA glycosylase
MQVSNHIGCSTFPCVDVRHEKYCLPAIEIAPGTISIVMVAEAAPADPADYFYGGGNPLFGQTTIQAFKDAGAKVSSVQDILDLGVYLTTAVKCGKIGYGVKSETIKACSLLLEQELALFPSVKVIMLMGDVAIKALNYIAQRAGEGRVIPAGSTYKIRNQAYFWRGKRVIPSYLQAGPSFFIEKSKRKTIAEDIALALVLAGNREPTEEVVGVG